MRSSIAMLKSLSAVALLALLAGCGEQATSAVSKPERPVLVQRVEFRSDDGSREFVGVVRARHETDLGFRVAGKIVARVVNAGDRVHAGDVVAQLDPQDLTLQVESAEAELAAATSSLTQAAADLGRYTTLKASGSASFADFDRKKTANDEAQGRLDRAKRALNLTRNQLSYADLKADAEGTITATLAEPDQVVAIGQAVARLARRGEVEAVVALPETWHTEARTSRATVQLWVNPKHRFSARLRELSPQADPTTRTYAARFTIEDPDDAVALGMTATVTLSHAVDASFAKLPLSAILNRGHGPSVYLVRKSGELELRPVKVASFTEDAALVTSGLADGDRVVRFGVQKLAAGQRVRATEEQ
jgi:RND family efflux transporter MFP subunit